MSVCLWQCVLWMTRHKVSFVDPMVLIDVVKGLGAERFYFFDFCQCGEVLCFYM